MLNPTTTPMSSSVSSSIQTNQIRLSNGDGFGTREPKLSKGFCGGGAVYDQKQSSLSETNAVNIELSVRSARVNSTEQR